jgi:hypothetical protein
MVFVNWYELTNALSLNTAIRHQVGYWIWFGGKDWP